MDGMMNTLVEEGGEGKGQWGEGGIGWIDELITLAVYS